MIKILVSGGAGAIGYHLCKSLSENNCVVYLADNYCRSFRDQAVIDLLKKKNVREIQIDLSKLEEYYKLPKDIDYIYHFAAMNGTQNFYQRPFDVLINCTLPTIHLLNYYAKSTSLKRFVYAGSSEAYASTISLFNWEVPTKENVPLGIDDPNNIRWSYGGSKLHGELATVAASHQYNIPFSIIRFHNVYGPRMGNKHVISDFLERAKNNIFELYGYEDTRSFIYVEDAVRATIQCAESTLTLNQIINLGGTPEISMLDLGKMMMKLLNRSEKISYFPSPKGSVKRRSPDLTLIKSLIGFHQTTSLEEGLTKTIHYYMNEVPH